MAVIAKVDCRVFCHINSLRDKISNTAAQIQPNPFWFWEKLSNIKIDTSNFEKLNLIKTYFELDSCRSQPHMVKFLIFCCCLTMLFEILGFFVERL